MMAALREAGAEVSALSPAAPPPAVLLTGDFNAQPWSDCVKAVLSDAALPLQSALGDQSAAGPGAFTTWKFRVYDDGSICEKRAVIDYVFHSSALRPVARWAQPTQAEIGPDALPSAAYPSDHLAVLVEFEWQEATIAPVNAGAAR